MDKPIISASSHSMEQKDKASGNKRRRPLTIKKTMKVSRKKRRHLTIGEKRGIFEAVDRGVSKSLIARNYNIERTAINHMLKQRVKIEEAYQSQYAKKVNKTKLIRGPKHGDTNKAVWIWFQEHRATYPMLPIPIELVKIKAIEFHEKLCPHQDFTASNGWYEKWAAQYNIRSIKCTGDQGSAPIDEVQPFVDNLLKVMRREELDLSQIYNFDESALMYRAIPSRSLVSYLERNASAYKPLKDRVTISTCYNVTGQHKVKLQIIGKSKNPRCFKSGYPCKVTYMSSSRAWQNQELFKTWFFTSFIPEVKEFQSERGLSGKAILLVDNASAHINLESDDGLIRTMKLPANTTSIIQPSDQNLILPLKVKYRKLLLRELSTVGLGDPQGFLKSFNLKQCIRLLHQAWTEMKPLVLVKSWNKMLKSYDPYLRILSSSGEEWDEEDELPIRQWTQHYDYDPNHWNEQESEEAASLQLTDEDILNKVRGISDDSQPDEVEQDSNSMANVDEYVEVSLLSPVDTASIREEHKQALLHLNYLENYYQGQEDGAQQEAVIQNLKSDLTSKIFNMQI